MRKNDKFIVHPEINEMIHICAVSPDAEDTKVICDLISIDNSKNEKRAKIVARRVKIESKLDKELQDTFPASDPITHY